MPKGSYSGKQDKITSADFKKLNKKKKKRKKK